MGLFYRMCTPNHARRCEETARESPHCRNRPNISLPCRFQRVSAGGRSDRSVAPREFSGRGGASPFPPVHRPSARFRPVNPAAVGFVSHRPGQMWPRRPTGGDSEPGVTVRNGVVTDWGQSSTLSVTDERNTHETLQRPRRYKVCQRTIETIETSVGHTRQRRPYLVM